jgi:hypothetical protein
VEQPAEEPMSVESRADLVLPDGFRFVPIVADKKD